MDYGDNEAVENETSVLKQLLSHEYGGRWQLQTCR